MAFYTSLTKNISYKIIIGVFATILILTTATLLFVKNPKTHTISDLAEAQAAIVKILSKNGFDSDIEALKMIEEVGNLFVLYRNNKTEDVSLATFQSFGILPNQYQEISYGGTSKPPKQIKTSGYYGAYKGVPEYLTLGIVYGVNTDRQAYSYTISLNQSTEYSRLIEDQYFIHLYYIDRSKDRISGFVYNKDGESIGWL
ncbi:MAG: hypothetical protein FWF37_00220 [Chloroflexi bacterium]|nr:hypothetical protein [Chloroflexota bacterium]